MSEWVGFVLIIFLMIVVIVGTQIDAYRNAKCQMNCKHYMFYISKDHLLFDEPERVLFVRGTCTSCGFRKNIPSKEVFNE